MRRWSFRNNVRNAIHGSVSRYNRQHSQKRKKKPVPQNGIWSSIKIILGSILIAFIAFMYFWYTGP